MRVSRTRLLLLLLSLLVSTATCSFSGSWPAPQTASRRVLANRRTGDASPSAGAMSAVLARATALEEDKAEAHAVEKVDVHVAGGTHGEAGSKEQGTAHVPPPPVPESQRNAFWTAVWRSYLVILFLEIGDRTFFIAALMSAKHPGLTVFVGAFGALLLMTVLSTALGVAAPLLLPHNLTHWAGAALFLWYGVTMLRKAKTMPSGSQEGPPDELEEVEDELKQQDDMRSKYSTGMMAKYVPPVLAQTFVMTFLAEWGDRSQIATITMGADYDAFGICVGGSAGHATATALAVVGGRLLAARISERTMAFAGGATFLLFGILACFEDPSSDITSQVAVPSWASAWAG